jgi:hypothetical protein
MVALEGYFMVQKSDFGEQFLHLAVILQHELDNPILET